MKIKLPNLAHWILIITSFALSISATHCFADADAEKIEALSKNLFSENRYVLLCGLYLDKNPGEDLTVTPKKYFSKDFLIRVIADCDRDKYHRAPVSSDFLDGVGPSDCKVAGEPDKIGTPCFHDYTFAKPKITGDKATIEVTYGKDTLPLFYTILKLIRENGQWRVDDVALIDRRRKEGDYSETRPSIKAEADDKIQDVGKKSR